MAPITHHATIGESSLPALPVGPARSRPEFEKLLIGPICVCGEMLTGGHYLEVLRIGKQTLPGTSTQSYGSLHKQYVKQSGFIGAFYRGMYPWGVMQCVKGIPVLFVQAESQYQLTKIGLDKNFTEPLSGVAGGVAQALFVCPSQKLKVVVVSDPVLNAMPPLAALKSVIKANGVTSLMDGLLPMMVRRGLDWMIRFTMSSKIKDQFVQRRVERGQDTQLQLPELMACGMIGGSFSAVTHPIDNVITNSQKPLPEGMSRGVAAVVKRIYAESGALGFTRGMGVKIVDNSYHTMWMFGVGSWVSQCVHTYLNEDE